MSPQGPTLAEDPLWYKDAVIYELRVRSFFDSNGDGIGDFRGLTQQLDYLQDLGVTALWLLPFYPSPMRDDGYDISDYTDVQPECGTLNDFKVFLREAHKRGLRVITELVLNHTSDQHPWFQRARRAKKGSTWRNFYVWSDTAQEYRDARIIFKDFELSNWTWDAVAEQYMWHRFYSNQPDLNFNHPPVHKALLSAMDFWFQLGVDGLRLDAVPYLYEREGTNCENLDETHEFLKKLRKHVDRKFPNRMLLAEANQWPEDAVAYFGDGDECHMAFHFPIMPRMFMAIQMENRYPIIEILDETPQIPEQCQWAMFLRNHDELTLEMVTDEERDYMYRMYASDKTARLNLGIRRRLAPLLGNSRRKIELMNGLLFSLPGTPVLYYGDEIGMGDNIYLGDRNGVRTPMQWSSDRNAGFSRANPQLLYLPITVDPEYHFETVNVETQQGNPQSLLWWMKRLIALRKRYPAFGRGDTVFLNPANAKVVAFVRTHGDERILVVANLSRFVQAAELDLSAFRGMTPVEMFGMNAFPPIGEAAYMFTLGPHAFYWFLLREAAGSGAQLTGKEERLPVLDARGPWARFLEGRGREALERLLLRYLPAQRWFGGKARIVSDMKIEDAVPVPMNGGLAYLAFVHTAYNEGVAETYLLPLGFATGEHAERLLHRDPWAAIATLRTSENGGVREGLLFDALAEPAFGQALLAMVLRRRQYKGRRGTLTAGATPVMRRLDHNALTAAAPRPLSLEQSNTNLNFADLLTLKVFRRVDEGVNPDLELGRLLTVRRRFEHVAPLAGFLEYEMSRGRTISVAVMHVFVPNHGNAWQFSLDELARFYEQVQAKAEHMLPAPPAEERMAILVTQAATELAQTYVGTYLESARLLGQRTAELHLALAEARDDETLAPEEFSTLYQRSLYQSLRTHTGQVLSLLRGKLRDLPAHLRPVASALLERESEVLARFRGIVGKKLEMARIRCHGDYHLGQVLYTGRDFVILDFEGEPARPVGERRIKRSPLRDVAGMLRSFDYAAHAALKMSSGAGDDGRARYEALAPWAHYWAQWSGSRFLRAYLDVMSGKHLLPKSPDDIELVLDMFRLEKALYELAYELNNRPDWADIPLQGLARLLDSYDARSSAKH